MLLTSNCHSTREHLTGCFCTGTFHAPHRSAHSPWQLWKTSYERPCPQLRFWMFCSSARFSALLHSARAQSIREISWDALILPHLETEHLAPCGLSRSGMGPEFDFPGQTWSRLGTGICPSLPKSEPPRGLGTLPKFGMPFFFCNPQIGLFLNFAQSSESRWVPSK